MSDPLSITASIIAVLQLTNTVVKFLKDVKGGSEDRVRLRDEIWNTISLLEMLKYRAEEAESDNESSYWDQKLSLANPLNQLEHLLEKVVSKLAPVRGLERTIQRIMWPFDKNELKEILLCIERQKTFFQLAIQNHHIGITQSIKDDLGEVSTNLSKLQIDQEFKQLKQLEEQVLDWLSPIQIWKKQRDLEEERIPGTCEWVFETSIFQNWFEGDRRILWCHGIPGGGKTIIASAIISRLVELQSANPHGDISFAFLYFNYKDQSEQTTTNMMSSILQQLLRKLPCIPQYVTDFYESSIKLDATPILQNIIELMDHVIPQIPKAYLIIDALDECTETDGRRSQLTARILKLPGNLKILCTSRDLHDIEQAFGKQAKLRIQAQNTDVEQFLNERMDRSSRLRKHVLVDPSLREEITTTIISRVQGMFLLAQLHVELLSKKQDRKSIRKALQTLPKTLDDMYDEAMKRIQHQDEEDAQLATNVLAWIAFALRPLSILDVRKAMAIENLDQDEQTLEEEALPEEEILVDVCAGLVTIDSESHRIRLVHYTAQEYFLRKREILFPSAQKKISSACLRYLCLDDSRYSTFEYPALYWGQHIVHGLEEELKDEIAAFFAKSDNLLAAISSIQLEEGGEFADPFLEPRGPPSNAYIQSALWLSTFFGLEYTARILILKGADVNTDQGHQLIWTAIFSRQERLFHLLLEHGAEIREPSTGSWSLLGMAARKGLLSVSRTLLDLGSDVKAQDERNGSALIGLVLGADQDLLGDWEELCRMVIEKGVDLEARLEPQGTALAFALIRKFTSTIRLILDAGANIEARNSTHQTLLVSAIGRGDYTTSRLLLDAGALTTDLDWHGFSALHHAADNGSLTQLLISYGTDIGRKSRAGETALHRSVALGCEEVVFILLSHGADINAASKEGITPIQRAVIVADTGFGSEPSLDRPNTIALNERAHVLGGNTEAWRVAFSNNGTRLASFGNKGIVEIYNVDALNMLQSLKHPVGGNILLWSPDDTILIVGCLNTDVYIWNTETWQSLAVFKSSKASSGLFHAEWVPGKAQFFTTSHSYPTQLCLWSCTGDLIRYFDVGRSAIYGCAFIPGVQRFIAFGPVEIFEFDTNSWDLVRRGRFDDAVERREFDHFSGLTRKDQQTPYGLFTFGGPHVAVNLETFEVVHIFDTGKNDEFSIDGTFGGRDGEYLAIGSQDGNIRIWDWNTKRLLCKQNVHNSNHSCNAVAWHPKEHNTIAIASDDGSVSIWTIETRSEGGEVETEA